VFFAKSQPFLLHFLSVKRLLCDNPGGHLQLLQNQPVDVLHRNATHFLHLLLDLTGGGTGVFLNKLLKDLEGMAWYLLWPSRALFPLRNLQRGQVPCCVEEAKDGGLVAAKAVGNDVHRDSLLSPG
jgi:hypothetical protein